MGFIMQGTQRACATARAHFDIAHGTFLWRRIPAFSRNATKRLVKHSRGYLRDSGRLHALLRIPDGDALLRANRSSPRQSMQGDS
jgi:predicted AAA+ superfamily ATPase